MGCLVVELTVHDGVPQARTAGEVALTVMIRDDGSGFAAATIPPSSGLGGMRERVELIGGELTIDTRLRDGTVVATKVALTERLATIERACLLCCRRAPSSARPTVVWSTD